MTAPERTSAPARPLRCLYADDVRELRELIGLILAQDGHGVDCVANGREALARLSAAPAAYDVVVTDHYMPDLDGLGLVRGLRALGYRGRVIVFTAELSPEVTAAYQELRVDCVLSKPALSSELRALFTRS